MISVFSLPPETPVKQCFIPPHEDYLIEYEPFKGYVNSYYVDSAQTENVSFMAVNSGSEGTYVSVIGVENDDQIFSDYGLYDVSLQTIEAYQEIETYPKKLEYQSKPSHIYCIAKKTQIIKIKCYKKQKTAAHS